jgi:hypothetical protein
MCVGKGTCNVGCACRWLNEAALLRSMQPELLQATGVQQLVGWAWCMKLYTKWVAVWIAVMMP